MSRAYKHTSLPPPYLKRVWIDEAKVPDSALYPFCLPLFAILASSLPSIGRSRSSKSGDTIPDSNYAQAAPASADIAPKIRADSPNSRHDSLKIADSVGRRREGFSYTPLHGINGSLLFATRRSKIHEAQCKRLDPRGVSTPGPRRPTEVEAVAEAADEEGGPGLSLVPLTERDEACPTDLLPPASESAVDCEPGAEAPDDPPIPATPFDGIPLEDSRKRLAGWSAERQRLFLAILAETGSVHLACAAARLTARSAYRLRARSPAFALRPGTRRTSSPSGGSPRSPSIAPSTAASSRSGSEGVLVAEKRVPSDRLLMWLLARLDPRRFAAPWELRKDGAADPQAEARESFPALLDALSDMVSE